MGDTSTPFVDLESVSAHLALVGPATATGALHRQILRSLNCEHIAPAGTGRREAPRNISPRRAAGRPVALRSDARTTAARRWFWGRRAGHGFIADGFPATLAEAQAFDEWLEARGEILDVCFYFPSRESEPAAGESVARHYRARGILATVETGDEPALRAALEPWLLAR